MTAKGLRMTAHRLKDLFQLSETGTRPDSNRIPDGRRRL